MKTFHVSLARRPVRLRLIVNDNEDAEIVFSRAGGVTATRLEIGYVPGGVAYYTADGTPNISLPVSERESAFPDGSKFHACTLWDVSSGTGSAERRFLGDGVLIEKETIWTEPDIVPPDVLLFDGDPLVFDGDPLIFE